MADLYVSLVSQGVLQNVRFVFGTSLDAILRNKGCQSGGELSLSRFIDLTNALMDISVN